MKFINLIVVCTVLLSSSCTKSKLKHSYYYIPMGYTGFVNIIYGQNASNNKLIQNGDTETYKITGDPSRFFVSNAVPESGEHISHYYYYNYYNKDSVIEIPNFTGPQKNSSQIFYEASASKEMKDVNGISKIVRIHQFYVADQPYSEQAFYKKYPDLINGCCN